METPTWPEALTKFGMPDPLEPARAAPRMREALRNATPHMDVRPPELAEVRDLDVPGAEGRIASQRGGCARALHLLHAWWRLCDR